MKANRLEAFSDGVIAIILTIMVLELKQPTDSNPKSLLPMVPTFLCYVLSFLTVAIYWVNHHHLVHLIHRVNGDILWRNIALLFWLSLVPWVTAYLGEHHAVPLSVALYGLVATACAITFGFLRQSITAQHANNAQFTELSRTMAKKNNIAAIITFASIPMAYLFVPAAIFLLTLPLLMYFMPDRRVESSQVE